MVVILDGVPVSSLAAVKDLSFEFKLELLQEGYLGETTDRYDSIFKGIAGDLSVDMSDPDVFNLVTSLVDKARRRVPGVKVNIKATLNFPSGRRARVTIRDAEFGGIPVNFGGRANYGTVKLSYGASEATAIAA